MAEAAFEHVTEVRALAPLPVVLIAIPEQFETIRAIWSELPQPQTVGTLPVAMRTLAAKWVITSTATVLHVVLPRDARIDFGFSPHVRELLRDLHAVHPVMTVGLYASTDALHAVSDAFAKHETLAESAWRAGLYFAMPTTSLGNMPPLSPPN